MYNIYIYSISSIAAVYLVPPRLAFPSALDFAVSPLRPGEECHHDCQFSTNHNTYNTRVTHMMPHSWL